jgi:fructose-bisphosphate aldolase, class I
VVDLSRISRNGRALFLAYDQGLEHGPSDFNDESVDPENILKIASSGFFTGFICQKGIAEKYYLPLCHSRENGNPVSSIIPLILKLNGKTRLANDEPMAEQICTVEEAIGLGASAVGYTIYLGSEFEEKMMKEFAEIEREAHFKNLPVIAWMYPRGSSVKSPDSVETIAYAARVGLEIGADVVKVRTPDELIQKNLEWIVKSAGRCRVVFAGGSKMDENQFLETAKIIKSSGAFGMAVGRNVWQSEKSLEVAEKLSKFIFG